MINTGKNNFIEITYRKYYVNYHDNQYRTEISEEAQKAVINVNNIQWIGARHECY